jgi:hypothetical protein
VFLEQVDDGDPVRQPVGLVEVPVREVRSWIMRCYTILPPPGH